MSIRTLNDDEENNLQSQQLVEKKFDLKMSSSSPSSNKLNCPPSSITFAPISDDALKVWSYLPEEIRLNPSLSDSIKNKKLNINVDNDKILTNNSLVFNMTLSTQPSFDEEDEEEDDDDDDEKIDETNHHPMKSKKSLICRYSNLIFLILCWMFFTFTLMTKSEKPISMEEINLPMNQVYTTTTTQEYKILKELKSNCISLDLEGPFIQHTDKEMNANLSTDYLNVWIEANHMMNIHNLTELWSIPMLPSKWINIFPDVKVTKILELTDHSFIDNNSPIIINLNSNSNENISMSIGYSLKVFTQTEKIIWASVILIGLYLLIIIELVHRTLAAMIASSVALAALAYFNEKVTTEEIISWIDIDTIILLFSMMILVAVIAETGIFDYLAVYAYKISGGRMWPLIYTLCIFATILSAFLDNVTMVLLMTPVTIRLCEVMLIDPVPILTSIIIFSNIGGTLTPVGDPPNVIIASNPDVIDNGVDFNTFIIHMTPAVTIIVIVVLFQIKYILRDIGKTSEHDEPQEIIELKQEIATWTKTAESLSSYSKDEKIVRESLFKKIRKLLSQLKKKSRNKNYKFDKYQTTLVELKEKYFIKNKCLLIKSGFTLLFVILLFFLHNLPHIHLTLGWTALLGVLLLFILADTKDLDSILARVEWSTLIFFSALFILMEALSRMGLIEWIGKQTELIIISVDENYRLGVALMIILWVSSITSAFVDNVPLATMMVRIIINLSKNDDLQLPLQPLMWALVFGASLGGNATLIGATANVVGAGIAEQHGYKFTFMGFLKVGLPITISTTIIASIYLLISHVLFTWH